MDVDWDNLALQAMPGQPQAQVQLNRAGDTVLAVLPVIQRSPGLLADLLPWLQARAYGMPLPALELKAEV